MEETAESESQDVYDVVICGGGLAGLCLARQLNQNLPSIKVLVIDKMARPLPVACHKVGESSIEAGATYFRRVLGLKNYLLEKQLPKLGLRFFWGGGDWPLHERCEYGVSELPEEPTVQLDRGTFESDLREFAVQTGSTLWEGMAVDDINLSTTGGLHRISCTRLGSSEQRTAQGRWVVDAMGRRQFIKRKLGLHEPFGRKHSSSWWRVKGRVNIEDMVPDEHEEWHQRVPNRQRYLSTNHMLGEHYWVWLIPLSSGYTSIGIVADEDYHPFDTFNTYERAQAWLAKHEPVLFEFLRGTVPEDFLVMKRYTYSAKQVFSKDRWALVGEAGVFSDPYFSTGSDLIAAANCMVSEFIRLDLEERAHREDVIRTAEQIFLTYSRLITENIQKLYDFSTNAVVGGSRYLWGNIVGPPHILPMQVGFLYHRGCLSDQARLEALRKVPDAMRPMRELGMRVSAMFTDWLRLSPNDGRFDFIDYSQVGSVAEMFKLATKERPTPEELLSGVEIVTRVAEELAQVVFRLAVEDALPEHFHKVRSVPWLNAWAISLAPERWESDGLFRPKNPPRDISALQRQVRGLFRLPADLARRTASPAHGLGPLGAPVAGE